MKKNKITSQQLSLDFDNDNNRVDSFQSSYQKRLLKTNTSTCKVISMNSFNQEKHNQLIERFYSLSDHLE